MNQTSISYNLDGLESLMRQIGGDYVARVGILESQASTPHYKTTPVTIGKKQYNKKTSQGSGLTNGAIGVIQEMGSITNNIPARSFLRLPIETKEKDIVKAMGGKTVQSAIENNQIKTVYSLLGVVAESYVKQAFSSGGYGQWAALNPQTIARKGSSAPLIDTGQLRRSITSDVVKKGDL